MKTAFYLILFFILSCRTFESSASFIPLRGEKQTNELVSFDASRRASFIWVLKSEGNDAVLMEPGSSHSVICLREKCEAYPLSILATS